jgi:transcription antitermination factor NusG
MTDSASNAPWVAVQVRSKMERTTAQHLAYRGYEYFLPLRPQSTQRAGKDAEAPLFPGYVFCRFDGSARAPIVTTPGVTRIVGFDGTPAFVDEEEISGIKRTLAAGQPVWRVTAFHAGMPVVITAGPLCGVRGTILGLGGRTFLVVSVTLLQRSIAVELDPSWVRIENPDAPVSTLMFH